MQLGRSASIAARARLGLGASFRFAAVASVVTGLAETNARADGVTTRASTEIAGYTDSLGVTVFTPTAGVSVQSPTSGWGGSGRYLLDVVSAASPDIVATASPRWLEIRHAGDLGLSYKPGAFGVAASGSTSYSPDYLSLGASGQLTQDLDNKNLTLIEGYSFGHDTIGRTGTPFSVFSHELVMHGFTAGFSRVVNPGLILGLNGDAILESGDQSKPYRYVPMFAPDVAPRIPRGATAAEIANLRLTARPLEQLPLTRQRWAVTGRLGWRTEKTTLRLEQRLYEDSWALRATTTDMRYFVDLGERFMIWPHTRVHAQSGVNFWQRAYVANGTDNLPQLRTGDRELGPLASFTLGAGARFALGKAGAKDDIALSFTWDGTWTSFTDAIYIRERFSMFGSTGLEMTFE